MFQWFLNTSLDAFNDVYRSWRIRCVSTRDNVAFTLDDVTAAGYGVDRDIRDLFSSVYAVRDRTGRRRSLPLLHFPFCPPALSLNFLSTFSSLPLHPFFSRITGCDGECLTRVSSQRSSLRARSETREISRVVFRKICGPGERDRHRSQSGGLDRDMKRFPLIVSGFRDIRITHALLYSVTLR